MKEMRKINSFSLKELREMDLSVNAPKIKGLPKVNDHSKYYPYINETLSDKYVRIKDIIKYIDNLRKSNDMWRYEREELWEELEELIKK